MAAISQISPLAGSTVNGFSAPGRALATIITLRIFNVTGRFTLAAWAGKPMPGVAYASCKMRQKSAAKNLSVLHGKPVVAQRMGAAA